MSLGETHLFHLMHNAQFMSTDIDSTWQEVHSQAALSIAQQGDKQSLLK